jgi:class 3 adenylate cyclase
MISLEQPYDPLDTLPTRLRLYAWAALLALIAVILALLVVGGSQLTLLVFLALLSLGHLALLSQPAIKPEYGAWAILIADCAAVIVMDLAAASIGQPLGLLWPIGTLVAGAGALLLRRRDASLKLAAVITLGIALVSLGWRGAGFGGLPSFGLVMIELSVLWGVALLLALTVRRTDRAETGRNLAVQALMEQVDSNRALSQRLVLLDAQISASTQLSELVASMPGPRQLLDETVLLLKDKFALRSVRIYLTDAGTPDALGLAASTEEAPRFLPRQPLHQVLLAGRPTIEALDRGDGRELARVLVPIRLGRRPLGLIGLLAEPGSAFMAPSELAGMQELAGLLAIGLENARLYGSERAWLRETLDRFVSPDVAEVVLSGDTGAASEQRLVTSLFCDLRDFTKLSESLSPREVVEDVNDLLTVIVAAADTFGGVVNKFGGDSTLIIYGAPTAAPDDPARAVRTALHIRKELALLNARRVQEGRVALGLGMGINSGVVVAGIIGTATRQEYTVLGDAVNLAARIQSLTRDYPEHDILVSQYTLAALGPNAAEFTLTPLGPVQIRGKSRPVHVFGVANTEKRPAPELAGVGVRR